MWSPWTHGPRFNIKMSFYQYRKSHCGDKTIVRSSYLHNGISYTGKTTSLYWIRALVSFCDLWRSAIHASWLPQWQQPLWSTGPVKYPDSWGRVSCEISTVLCINMVWLYFLWILFCWYQSVNCTRDTEKVVMMPTLLPILPLMLNKSITRIAAQSSWI